MSINKWTIFSIVMNGLAGLFYLVVGLVYNAAFLVVCGTAILTLTGCTVAIVCTARSLR